MSEKNNSIIDEIAKVLSNSSYTIQKREEIASYLNTEPAIISQLRRREATEYEFFKEIVSAWFAKNGVNASKEKFIEIMRKEGFNEAAG